MPDRLLSFNGEIPDIPVHFFDAGGARMRYAICEPEGAVRGTFLIPQGRREFMEKKYLEVGAGLRARGFRIIMFDWRGQGLSSRLLPGSQSQHDHITDFDIYIKDLQAFYRDVIKPRPSGPFLIMAHSMGALITVRWLLESQGRDAPEVKALIMTSPALSIGVPAPSRMIALAFVKLGMSERYAGGQRDYGAHDRGFTRNILSHDKERFSVIEKYFTADPQYAVGGVTWGWLAAAMAATESLEQPGYLERLKIPVLALFAGRDIVTPPVKVIPLIRRMPNAEAVVIRGALHDLMNESDHYRDQAWRHIDEFLKQVIRG